MTKPRPRPKPYRFSGKDLRKMSLVEVVWDDAATSGRWLSLKTYIEDRGIVECRAVGYLTKKNAREIQVVQQISKEGDVSDSVTIPRSCVRRIRRLR